ncbi:hypothetical protein FJT64_007022 [Amphibalanus amphitrite]|uniref:Uncharacterized protein n=1 Tax=Amphibalanus amphitrite TaxID=1232801 RepID=A0A6A4VG96_AMPAM|nr:hypothetical protein FJT64_007022 [Amphibalanus amphitrite]
MSMHYGEEDAYWMVYTEFGVFPALPRGFVPVGIKPFAGRVTAERPPRRLGHATDQQRLQKQQQQRLQQQQQRLQQQQQQQQ